MADYEYTFDPGLSNDTAASVYRLARSGGSRVLDLGSGPAIVSSYLAGHDEKDVTCVDRSQAALDAAASRGVERTVVGDLANSDWAEPIAGEQFDVIIMADVLEHLINPRQLLEDITRHSLLSTDGYLVVSIPNAGHEAVVAELVHGRFTYQDTGLLDSTHVRFFTLATLRTLLESCGFFIKQVERTHRTAEQTSLSIHDATLPPDLRNRILQAAPEAQTYQFVVRAEPADAAKELAETREQLGLASAELAETSRRLERVTAEAESPAQDGAEIAALRSEITRGERTRQQLKTEAELANRELALLRQRLGQVEGALERERKRHEQAVDSARTASEKKVVAAKKEFARLERKIADIYGSRTWKVGRTAWNAFHLPGKVLHRSTAEVEPGDTSPDPAPMPIPPVPVQQAAVDYPLVENHIVREKYEQALARRAFSGTARNVAIAVYTTDLTAGRGDIFTAVGIGRHLEQIGYEVIYLPRDRWYDLPEGTEIFVAMLESADITQLPSDVTTVAWVRNETTEWMRQPWLPFYDLVLASSPRSLDEINGVYAGPTGLLPIGVDIELFAMRSRAEDRVGVVSTVNQWGRERELFSHLKEVEPQWPLALYGEGRGMTPQLTQFSRGPVSFFALPSLYNQAAIVLDDFNHTTAGFGNVNSRVFEALACGAIVMTNRSTGLDAVGFDELPVYASAADLVDLVERDLGSQDARKVAVARAATVAERHSYAQRAAEFITHLGRLDETATPAEAADRLVVSFYPDYRDNPYLEMMWSELRSRASIAVPIGDNLDFAAAVRAAEYHQSILHLNWTAPILGAARDEHSRLVRYRRFLEGMDEMHDRGVPSIWTIHNVLPHECRDPDLEAKLRQEIADRVDLIHVMCDQTVTLCAEWFQIPQAKVRMVPHPSYIDVYPNLVDGATARHQLGLRPDDHVYLHFGQVRPYKGVDLLLDAFDRLSRHDPAAKLLLVGKPGRFEGVRQIIDRARANPSVIANFNSVPDGDVQLYMNAADVAVLPHRTALNSGALLLAYSFALPVIAPATGCMAGQVDELTGISFDWGDGSQGLTNALLAGRDLGAEHGRAAYERARGLHYLGIGKRFAALVDELLV